MSFDAMINASIYASSLVLSLSHTHTPQIIVYPKLVFIFRFSFLQFNREKSVAYIINEINYFARWLKTINTYCNYYYDVCCC